MTGEPIIFYNFVFPSVRFATMLLRGLSQTVMRQSAAFLLAKPSWYWYETLYKDDREKKIHGKTNSTDRQHNSYLKLKNQLLPLIFRRESESFSNDFLDVFRWKTERHEIFNIFLLLLL